MKRYPAGIRQGGAALLIFLSGLAPAQSAPSIQVIPSAPHYLEPVYLRTNMGTSAALIYGDGIITPAISVLSATEGLLFLRFTVVLLRQ